MIADSTTADHRDVAAYLFRLGLDREPPSADALARLHRAQVEHVPYETLWIHAGDVWDVDIDASVRRVAHQRRGGYCFHVNGAFSRLLAALGYDVTLHAGGVHGADGPAAAMIDNHLVLLVHGLPTDDHPDGTWYVDAGLGDALHGPLPLREGTHVDGVFEFRLERVALGFADWHLHHHRFGSFPGMAFEAAPTTIERFAARNQVLATSAESVFTRTVTAQRRDARGVDLLRGQVLSHVGHEVGAGRTLESRDDWFGTLRDVFGLPLDDLTDDQRDRLWQRVHHTHETWLASRSDA
jgi:N-hydroxyarylamine O-acetyltransferase